MRNNIQVLNLIYLKDKITNLKEKFIFLSFELVHREWKN